MTSSGDQQNKHHQTNAILFFKMIVRTSLAVGKLKIPNNFTRKYGGGLLNPMFLKPPDGTEWKVYWTNHDGEIWFEKGWKEFARCYSLDHGHMVMFEYKGTHFEVHIFDMSATEIDYSFNVTHGQKDSLNQISEDSVEILDEQSPCKETRLKSTITTPQPPKKKRARDVGRSSNPQNLHQHAQAKEDMDGDMCSTECPKAEQLTSTKTTVASITATTFRSKKPNFILVMKPSHVNGYSLRIPVEFAENYLKKPKGLVHLQALDERSWSVVYNFPSITAGWNKFASDNNLNVGNVCVFELTKRKKSFSFKVFIFRVAEQPSCSLSHDRNASQSQATALLISPCLGMIRPLKEAKKFNSENPIFMVKLKQSFMGRHGITVPCLFMRKYFDKKKQTVIIQFGKRLWPVSLLCYEYKITGKLGSGWPVFAEESKLQAGDVCIFELINGENSVLGVHVFRGSG